MVGKIAEKDNFVLFKCIAQQPLERILNKSLINLKIVTIMELLRDTSKQQMSDSQNYTVNPRF